uniref:Uncharacterized protein n=1 Tax=uncultured bacterium A1Q1_fos_2067 TaxID=1256560 RepID=L7VY43_9BACT|nr:hypothetical protein [uncultured bacterium A1Q1_fos_2067]
MRLNPIDWRNSHTSSTVLRRLQRSRFVRWVQLWAAFSLVLQPLVVARSSWVDSDNDGNNDAWHDSATTEITTLSTINLAGTDADFDGATNEQEAASGSNPFDPDSDGDGLMDGFEINTVFPVIGVSPTSWDSDGDFLSDFDEWYIANPASEVIPGFSGVHYSGSGELPPYSGASYSDFDGDGVENPFDAWPTDPDNHDTDHDGVPNDLDPAPQNWDRDGDGIADGADAHPDDPYNGNTPEPTNPGPPDSDGDGHPDDSDPFPSDFGNNGWGTAVLGDDDVDGYLNYLDPYPNDYSNSGWGTSALNDDDGDGIPNYNDGWPNDFTNGASSPTLPDSDGDGIPDIDDPFAGDSNNGGWGTDVLGNPDGDAYANWQDPHPGDSSNFGWGNDALSNWDGDDDVNWRDPFPWDSTNNGWFGNAHGDTDGDGVENWTDPTPDGVLAPDSDGDGWEDATDPYPNDYSNNGWYGSALEDSDYDGILNHLDSYPNDSTNGQGTQPTDSDGDGIPDSADPYISDSGNNGWYSMVLEDPDMDGIPNYQDSYPNDSSNGANNPPPDADYDGIPDATDPYPNDSMNNGWYGNVFGDNDSDGFLNYQDSYPDDSTNGVPPDSDGDGLTDSQESGYGTDAQKSDTDEDGLTDYEELIVHQTDPLNAWSVAATLGFGTLYDDSQLVNLTDSDGDTIPDSVESHYGLDPQSSSDGNGDLDANSITNRQQYAMGRALDIDLIRYDEDGDGMSDTFEDFWGFDRASFDDALNDLDGDGVLNVEEQWLNTLPNNSDSRSLGQLGDYQVLLTRMFYPEGDAPTADSDEDGEPDWIEAKRDNWPLFYRQLPGDWDADGLPDTWEHRYGLWQYPDGLYVRQTDSGADPDEDGLPNLTEYQLGYHPLIADSDNNTVPDGDEDFDDDGLTNAEEVILGSNAAIADSDGDGITDDLEDNDHDGISNFDEVIFGTDPNSNTDLDDDGIADDWELFYDLDPNDPTDALLDHDEDGIITRVEFDSWRTDPWEKDTDGDGINDFDEVAMGSLVEFNKWAAENDTDFDGLLNSQETVLGTNPAEADTDGDGLMDSWEVNFGYNPLSKFASLSEISQSVGRFKILQAWAKNLEAHGIIGTTVSSGTVGTVGSFTEAESLLTMGDLPAALSAFESEVSLFTISTGGASIHSRSITGRGIAKFYSGDLEAALTDFQSALAFDPQNQILILNAVNVLVKLERYSEARQVIGTLGSALADNQGMQEILLAIDDVEAGRPTQRLPQTASTGSQQNGTSVSFGNAALLETDPALVARGLLDHPAFSARVSAIPAPTATPSDEITFDDFRVIVDSNGLQDISRSLRPYPILEANLDSDGDHLSNLQEHSTYQPYGDTTAALNPRSSTDADHDGMADDWELFFGLDATVNDGSLDPDNDGLVSKDEFFWSDTSPVEADTNQDSVSDGTEWRRYWAELETTYGADRREWVKQALGIAEPTAENMDYPEEDIDPYDLDGDGLTNDEERLWGTDPTQADTDQGGISDGQEVNNHNRTDGFTGDPLDPSDDQAQTDTDEDGIGDNQESFYGTNPNNPDTDGGGELDGSEVEAERDPLDPSDDDGDHDGLSAADEAVQGTDPEDPDSDDGGESDGSEVNGERSPLNDIDDQPPPDIQDEDEDGMDDNWERQQALDPTDPADAEEDPDDDQLDNLGEYQNGTDPYMHDTDQGGIKDGVEVANREIDPVPDPAPATDPLDPVDDSDLTCRCGKTKDEYDPNDPYSNPDLTYCYCDDEATFEDECDCGNPPDPDPCECDSANQCQNAGDCGQDNCNCTPDVQQCQCSNGDSAQCGGSTCADDKNASGCNCQDPDPTCACPTSDPCGGDCHNCDGPSHPACTNCDGDHKLDCPEEVDCTACDADGTNPGTVSCTATGCSGGHITTTTICNPGGSHMLPDMSWMPGPCTEGCGGDPDCPLCNGSNQEPESSRPEIPCSECGGDGVYESTADCSNCGADGLVEDLTTCACGGDKRIQCPDCYGDGYVYCDQCGTDGKGPPGPCNGGTQNPPPPPPPPPPPTPTTSAAAPTSYRLRL